MPSTRSLLAAALSGASLAGAVGLAVMNWNPIAATVATVSTDVQPVAVSRNLECSGSLIASVADSTSWTRVAKVQVGIAGGHSAGQFVTEGEPDGTIVTYDGTPDAVAATESASVSNDLAAGFLAAECGDATNSQWFIGGSTETGRDGVLTISNSSGVEARVDLEFWGAQGAISAPAASGLVIPAGSQRSYSLAGFAPNEASPVIHVVSTGAAVWASLQVSTVRGLVPGGVDRITGVGEPSTSVVIPVVRQPKESLVGPLRSDPDYLDTVTDLRLFTPGESDATASVTVTPFDGSEPVVVEATVSAGTVVDIPIDELATGDYSVTVSADQPVLAAVRFASHSTKSGITDLAWATNVEPRSGVATAFIPKDNSVLAFVNTGDSDAIISVINDANESTVTVAAGATMAVPVARGYLRVDSDVAVSTSVLVSTDAGVAVIKLPSEPLGARSVTVIAH